MNRKISDIAEVRTGYQFRGKVAEARDGNVSLIQIKDLTDDGSLDASDLTRVRHENPAPYLVERGDVLFLARGARLAATLVDVRLDATIATGFFFILRGNPEAIRPDFLAWTLNQPGFQEALRPFVRGTHMPLVSKADFQEMTLAVPPLVVQDRVIELQALFDRERRLTATLERKRLELVRAVSGRLISGRLKIMEGER